MFHAGIITSIHQVKVKLYTSNPDRVVKGDGFLIYDLSQPLPLCGDVKIEVNYKSGLRKVSISLHCDFIEFNSEARLVALFLSEFYFNLKKRLSL